MYGVEWTAAFSENGIFLELILLFPILDATSIPLLGEAFDKISFYPTLLMFSLSLVANSLS